jgi:hypothetical protein
MTTASPKPLRAALSPVRELAAFVLLGVAALLLLTALTNLVPTDFQRFGAPYGFYLAVRPPGFLSVVTVAAPVLAVLLVTTLGEPAPRARLVTVAAASLLAVASFFGLIFELLIAFVGMVAAESFLDGVKVVLPPAALLGLALLALLVVFRVWQGLFVVARPVPSAPAGWGAYGYPAQYGQPQYSQPQYGQPAGQPGTYGTPGYPPAQPGYGPPAPGHPGSGPPAQPGPASAQVPPPAGARPTQPEAATRPARPEPAAYHPAYQPPSYPPPTGSGQPTMQFRPPAATQPGGSAGQPAGPGAAGSGQVYGQPAGQGPAAAAPAGPDPLGGDDPDRTSVVRPVEPAAGAPSGEGSSGSSEPDDPGQPGWRAPAR